MRAESKDLAPSSHGSDHERPKCLVQREDWRGSRRGAISRSSFVLLGRRRVAAARDPLGQRRMSRFSLLLAHVAPVLRVREGSCFILCLRVALLVGFAGLRLDPRKLADEFRIASARAVEGIDEEERAAAGEARFNGASVSPLSEGRESAHLIASEFNRGGVGQVSRSRESSEGAIPRVSVPKSICENDPMPLNIVAVTSIVSRMS